MTPETRTVPRRTVAGPAEWEGPGLHTGAHARVTVEPSTEPGLFFVTDKGEIPALADHMADTRRCTVLSCGAASVATVEHLLAALAGLGIWAARIRVSGPEIPILDGSAGPFVEKLREAGTREVGTVEALVPGEGRVEEGDAVRSWAPAPESPSATFLLAGSHPLLAGQRATIALDDPAAFADEVAPCRTWAPIEQVQPLIDQGLIRGGTLENALVVYPDRYSSPLRREGEPARHKLLDLIGDMALVGMPVLAAVTASGGGHTLNVGMARALRSLLTQR